MTSTTHYTTTTTPTSRSTVAVLTMDSPPVNSLSKGTRAGLVAGVQKALSDPTVKAIIVRGAGRAFCAGAEITEFASSGGSPAVKEEPLTATISRLETCPIPVVALVHGFALGGGFEVALGCHYRVATKDAMFGLPEVNLGLLPGAGGTQRLPRIIGAAPALQAILSGEPTPAPVALKLGTCDVLLSTPDEIKSDQARLTSALAFVESVLGKPRPVRARAIPDAQTPDLANKLAAILKQASAKRRGEIAPEHIYQCIQAALAQPTFDAGMAEETRLFNHLLASPEARAMQHVFFAERAVAKLPKEFQVPPAPLTRVGIVGAGLMGGGIAMSCIDANIPVVLLDAKQEFLDKGLALIKTNYAKSVERKSITQAQMDARLKLLTPTLDYNAFSDCDLVVEAVYEDMRLKKEIFGKLDKVCKPGCILASNTSGLNIDDIAAATSRPGDVVGCHFFSPANVMKLLENVRGSKSSPRAVATAMAFGHKIRKIPVLVGNCPGFVGNRMLWEYSAEAEKLAIEGASVARVDQVAEKILGVNMGPFRMSDLVGLELFHRKRKSEGRADPKTIIEDALCEAGRFGMRAGKGYYVYADGRTAQVDPAVDAIVATVAQNRNVRRRTTPDKLTDQEIFERLVFPLINEGYKILDEGFAYKSSDIDMVYLNGYGWPKYRGGPMKMAEEIGPDVVLATLLKYRRLGHKEKRWVPAKGLVEAARKATERGLAGAKM